MDQSDSHHPLRFEAQALRQLERVVVPVPHEDADLAQFLSQVRCRDSLMRNRNGWQSVAESFWIGNPPDLDVCLLGQSVQKVAEQLAFVLPDRIVGDP